MGNPLRPDWEDDRRPARWTRTVLGWVMLGLLVLAMALGAWIGGGGSLPFLGGAS